MDASGAYEVTIFQYSAYRVDCGNLEKSRKARGGALKRELDSLVTQMHSSGIHYEDAVSEFKRQFLREVLIANRGNQCKAAEELGMHRNTLSRAMAELGLSLSEVRAGLKRPPRSERPVFGTVRQTPGPSPGCSRPKHAKFNF